MKRNPNRRGASLRVSSLTLLVLAAALPAAGEDLFGIRTGKGLYVYDPALEGTGAPVRVGVDPCPTCVSLSARPSDGRLFTFSNGSVKGDLIWRGLTTVDHCTGVWSHIVPEDSTLLPTGQIGGLAFSPSGELFASSNQLFSLDPDTGHSTLIGDIRLVETGQTVSVFGMDFGPDGRLYGSAAIPRRNFAIVSIDTSTAAATTLSVLPGTSLSSVTFDESGALIASDQLSNSLVEIDPASGSVTTLAALGFDGVPYGMDFAPDCEVGYEICGNGIDDNQNGFSDCDDPVCIDSCVETVCFNQVDDDEDGLLDCADPDCARDLFCSGPICGNGVLEPGESCDDGNLLPGDGCRQDCSEEVCGDLIQDPQEQCDDGNLENADGCQANCALPRCGDAIVDPDEQCDDANASSGDGCSETCGVEFCGNAVVDFGEECDDGNSGVGDGCRPSCTQELCGDGTLDPQEPCDDANNVAGDGCRADCSRELCGDGTLDPQEQCDDGNVNNADGCQANCALPFCGDAIADAGEQCDDGNTAGADGCSATCTVEICGNGIFDPFEQCDDGNTVGADGCRGDCTIERCGDGIVDPQEQCDDGNLASGDGCSDACLIERSGGGEGCTPGYWKQEQHFDAWPADLQPSTLFSSVFDEAFPGMTLVQVLRQGGGGLKALGRHAVAARLNAAATRVSYDLSPAEVVSMFNAAHPGATPAYETLKDNLESLNQQYCPL